MFTDISFNLQSLYGEKPPFITPAAVKSTQQQVTAARLKVENQLQNQDLGFVNLLTQPQLLEKVEAAYQQVSWAKTLVVVGIGGSDLGGRAIVQALESSISGMKVIFHGDTTDPVAIKNLLNQIELKDTVFNIVSKSGGTLETLAAYVFLKGLVRREDLDLRKHFIFTTSASQGLLKEEASKLKIPTLEIPEDVGGRFSVLSSVGLFPARCLGVEIEKLLHGAKLVVENEAGIELAFEMARSQFELYQQGIKLAVLMPYSVQLNEFARWYRQLWAESLGKNDQGIMPIQAFGPADQHSQIQFYNQGSPLQSVWFLTVKNRKINYPLLSIDLKAAQFLEGHTFHELINLEAESTAEAMTKHGRPNAMLQVKEVSAFTLGQLFMIFELGVVFLAAMLEVNPFDQPGVEEAKKIMNAKLGQK